jgi:hypothetical protein
MVRRKWDCGKNHLAYLATVSRRDVEPAAPDSRPPAEFWDEGTRALSLVHLLILPRKQAALVPTKPLSPNGRGYPCGGARR